MKMRGSKVLLLLLSSLLVTAQKPFPLSPADPQVPWEFDAGG
ncbi:MAG: hypothetical protein ABSF45_23650 [Terriglobia bacterium]|jgi:hypothetical protein